MATNRRLILKSNDSSNVADAWPKGRGCGEWRVLTESRGGLPRLGWWMKARADRRQMGIDKGGVEGGGRWE